MAFMARLRSYGNVIVVFVGIPFVLGFGALIASPIAYIIKKVLEISFEDSEPSFLIIWISIIGVQAMCCLIAAGWACWRLLSDPK